MEFGVSVLRKYPWFSDKIFQDAFGEDVNPLYKEKFISYIQQRDLAWGVRSDRKGYERELEVYHPNFCGKQLGFRQVIQELFFDPKNCETSYCLRSPLEVIFRVTQPSLKVMSKIAFKPVVLNF